MKSIHKLSILVLLSIICLLQSCSSSKVTISHDANLYAYKYIVFGQEDYTGNDDELNDIILSVQNEIAKTNLRILSLPHARNFALMENSVLSPSIAVKSEKWDGGHTYITITFYDFATHRPVIILKSSGIGLSIKQDQKIAFKAIRKQIFKTFGKKY